MKRLSPGLMLAGLGMSIAVAVLMLFAAGVTYIYPLSALCLFVAALMIWVPIREEHGLIFAVAEYVIVSGVSLLISRSSVFTYLYVLIFGHYGIVRFLLRRKLRDRLMTVLIRLLIFNLLAAIGLAVARYGLGYDIMTFLPDIPLYIIIPILEAGFLVFMALYKLFSYLFDTTLRSALLPRR